MMGRFSIRNDLIVWFLRPASAEGVIVDFGAPFILAFPHESRDAVAKP